MTVRSLKFPLFVLLSFAFIMLILFVLTFPKFLIFDRLLMSKGVYMTAGSIEEGLVYVKLRDVNLYDSSSSIARFDELELSLGFLKLSISGLCGDGNLYITFHALDGMDIKASSFNCLRDLQVKKANIRVNRGIEGSIEFGNLTANNLRVDQLSINFKGRTFEAEAFVSGLKLLGEGIVVLNRKDMLKSSINGTAVGGGLSLVVYGTIEKPQLSLK
ncbi:MAG: hypothetical protein ACK4SM_02595 [Aquificaceae bacterium]